MAYCFSISRAPANVTELTRGSMQGAGFRASWRSLRKRRPLYGDMVARILAAQRGLSKKCLVLDLDNTLWGGVIGDDGLEGIVLGEGSAAGEAHLALQRYAKQLKERGVILAVCSKNDPGSRRSGISRSSRNAPSPLGYRRLLGQLG